MKISEIYQKYEQLFNENIIIQGWILTARKQKEITFIKINDGSHSNGIQLVLDYEFEHKLFVTNYFRETVNSGP
jgi:aspartyl/asparaginyl-tRNA synthetase